MDISDETFGELRDLLGVLGVSDEELLLLVRTMATVALEVVDAMATETWTTGQGWQA